MHLKTNEFHIKVLISMQRTNSGKYLTKQHPSADSRDRTSNRTETKTTMASLLQAALASSRSMHRPLSSAVLSSTVRQGGFVEQTQILTQDGRSSSSSSTAAAAEGVDATPSHRQTAVIPRSHNTSNGIGAAQPSAPPSHPTTSDPPSCIQQQQYFHSSPTDLEGDLDDLCKKHMELPSDQFAEGCSFLQQVALGNLDEVRRRVERCMAENSMALVNFRDYDRRSAVHLAASEGHLEIVKYLLSKGGRLNRSDRWGGSPMDDAYRHKHFEVLEYLRECGGTFGSKSQATNFISAAFEGDIDEVQTLHQLGSIDINEADYDKRTALHVAASNGNLDVVRYLCLSGANVNVVDRWNHSPLDDAKFHNQDKCVELLLKYGASFANESSYAQTTSTALLDLFEQYCKVRDGKMSLDWHDVKDLLHGVGEDATDDVVRKLFGAVDDNGDGIISRSEFLEHSDLFLNGRPARIILVVGGPGSGKGLLSERLVKECGVVHISSGDLLREEVQSGSHLGKQVEEIMKSGGLVSSAIMVALMQKRMKDHPGKRILLDGFPRSAENARDLVTLCGKPELALHLDCDDTILIERILHRGKSGARADDNITTALQRIRNYHKFHQVTLDFLREERVPIVNLDCSTTPDGVWEQLSAVSRLMRNSLDRKRETKEKDDISLPA